MSVLKEAGGYRMWLSWRPKMAVAALVSADGLHWSDPQIVLGPNRESGWEDDINRPVVLERDGVSTWYTGFSPPGSATKLICTSVDGKTWQRQASRRCSQPSRPGKSSA